MRKILMKNDRMDSVRGADSSIGSAATFGAKAVRLFFVALTVVFCAGMWGCGELLYEDGERKFFDVFIGSHIVGFVDDSLVIVADDKEWSQETSNGYAIGGRGRQRLRVFNYRVQEEGSRWADTLDNYTDVCNYALGQLSDSVIWGGKTSSYTYVWEGPVMSFWKIGEKPHEMKIKKVSDGCNVDFMIAKMHQWLDGKFIGIGNGLSAGGDSCQYAVLDTVARTLTYKRLDDGLKWIQKCDDVRAWGDDVYCLMLLNDPMDLYLVKNAVIVDSLLQGNPYEWMKYTKVGFVGNMLNLGNNLFEIVDDDFFSVGVSVRRSLEFRTNEGYDIIY